MAAGDGISRRGREPGATGGGGGRRRDAANAVSLSIYVSVLGSDRGLRQVAPSSCGGGEVIAVRLFVSKGGFRHKSGIFILRLKPSLE